MVINVSNYLCLTAMDTLSGEVTLLKNVRSTSGKSDNSKKKEIAPLGIVSKYILFQVVTFSNKVLCKVHGNKCL